MAAAVKVTNLFNAGTIDADGNAARSGGFSESFYSTIPLDSASLGVNWTRLCQLRAALLPKNVRICGGRWANVDPVGGSVSFDTAFPGASTALNDHPSMALQFTVRSAVGFNERSVILRGIPDARVVTGEYAPSDAFNAALTAYFAELQANWKFRALDRTVLPVKIISITNAGLMTTATPHGLNVGDKVNLMSVVDPNGEKVSMTETVLAVPTVNTATLFMSHDAAGNAFTKGRVRKIVILYQSMRINPSEIITPVAITFRVGRPFRQFRGRQTARHR